MNTDRKISAGNIDNLLIICKNTYNSDDSETKSIYSNGLDSVTLNAFVILRAIIIFLVLKNDMR